MTSRIETDSLGNIPVPANAYWGAHTARALENFTISGIPISRHPHLVRSLAMIKNAAAQANCELGRALAPAGGSNPRIVPGNPGRASPRTVLR